MNDDLQLMRDYMACRSELAFETIVARYVNLVYSAALRQVRDPHLAEEVTQTVFILLARKAGSFNSKTVLASWLHRTACFVARDALKSQMRRARREQEAYMQSASNESQCDVNEAWQEIAPVLDSAIAALGEKDRQAIVLRFLENQSFGEVGKTLGMNEDASRMRVQRAVEKLRAFLAKRGVVCTTLVLGVSLSERAISAAPATLVSSISKSVVSGGAASALSTLEVLKFTARLKARFLVAVGIGTIAVFMAGLYFYEAIRSEKAPVSDTAEAVVPVTGGETGRVFAVDANARPVAAPEDDLAELIAQLRAALYSTKTSQSPSADVVVAVERFGNRKKILFDILKQEALKNEDAEEHSIEDIAWTRAVLAMGYLEHAVPEAIPFLWNLYQSTAENGNESRAVDALYGLHSIGFQPKDIPALATNVVAFTRFHEMDGFIRSQAAEWIIDLLKKNPASVKAYAPDVERLLYHEDYKVRFWAALALAEYEGDHYPGIFDEIASNILNSTNEVASESFKGVMHPDDANPFGYARLESAGIVYGNDTLAWASENIFKKAGQAMRPMVSALVDAAKASKDPNARKWALLAAGKIDPDLRRADPEVAQLLQDEEEHEAWLIKINSGKANFFELQKNLKDPERAYVAAEELGRMGPVAADAVPDMVRALLASKDSDHGERIFKALKEIDPEAAKNYEPIPLEVLQSAMEKVQARQSPSSKEQAFRLVAGMMEGKTSGPWPSRAWLADFGKKLAAIDPDAYQTFVTNVVKRDPSLKSAFTP
jgi:RNA polymerase sigma factor (sigma-70 family)